MPAKRMTTAIGFILLIPLVLAVAWYINTRPTLIIVAAEIPVDFPEDGFSHTLFENLLKRFVDEAGRVDYDMWHAEQDARAELDSYLAAVAAYSPVNAANRFKDRNDQKAYWIYAYNALVIKSIVDQWPLNSVTDIKAPVEVIRGLGFFYNQEFVLGGERYNLYRLEKVKILEDWQDPRVHFVSNCGSESCPVLRPELPLGDKLETLLTQATQDFISNPKNVNVDHKTRQVTLSAIFKWYSKDFVNELRRRSYPPDAGILDYLELVGSGQLRADVGKAKDYELIFKDYDWSVNLSREAQ